MDRSRYLAVLGLGAHATAAEVEERYLALAQFFEGKNIPGNLSGWATAQAVALDEAYAALSESDEEADSDKPARAPDSQRARAVAIAPHPSKQRKAVRREEFDDDEDADEFEDEYDDEFEDDPPSHRQAGKRQGSALKASAQDARSGRPTWQEPGKKTGRNRGYVEQPRRRKRSLSEDSRSRRMLLGIAAGLVVVALFVAIQTGFGPFAKAGDVSGVQTLPFDQARYEQLKAAVAKDPKNYPTLFELGEMNIDSERYEESITWFTKLLEVKPDDVHAMQDIGTAHFSLGRREQALAMWEKALEVDPNNAQTHWNLSFYYAGGLTPNIDAAVNEWRKVVELAPNTELAKTAQAHLDQYVKKQSQ